MNPDYYIDEPADDDEDSVEAPAPYQPRPEDGFAVVSEFGDESEGPAYMTAAQRMVLSAPVASGPLVWPALDSWRETSRWKVGS
jgi:hypothetical protein